VLDAGSRGASRLAVGNWPKRSNFKRLLASAGGMFSRAPARKVPLSPGTGIHKSQGSEYPAVVIPVLTQHYAMLQRNLLYTGVTRGKRLVAWSAKEGCRDSRAQRVATTAVVETERMTGNARGEAK